MVPVLQTWSGTRRHGWARIPLSIDRETRWKRIALAPSGCDALGDDRLTNPYDPPSAANGSDEPLTVLAEPPATFREVVRELTFIWIAIAAFAVTVGCWLAS